MARLEVSDMAHPPAMTRSAAIAADVASGMAAGMVAALAMNLFQAGWAKLAARKSSGGADSTRKTADAVSKAVGGKPVRKRLRNTAAGAVHYATGAAMGGVYGLVSGMIPAITAGNGALFGAIVWLGADEIAVPAFGLGKAPDKVAPGDHAYALVSHLVFGVVLDTARRIFNYRGSAD